MGGSCEDADTCCSTKKLSHIARVGNVGYLVARTSGTGPTLYHPGDMLEAVPEGVDVLAVPINAFTQTIVAQLISQGRVRRAFLGVAGGTRPLPPRSATAVGHTHGFEVITVTPGSAADRAGIRVEDVLVEIDGVPVRDASDLQALMVEQRIGTAIAVTLVRSGAARTVDIVPEELPTR